jgi:hypothetical protein
MPFEQSWGCSQDTSWTIELETLAYDRRRDSREQTEGQSLLKQRKDKNSVAMRHRMAGWNTKYLSQFLGLSWI